jgi:hypothetical protein
MAIVVLLDCDNAYPNQQGYVVSPASPGVLFVCVRASLSLSRSCSLSLFLALSRTPSQYVCLLFVSQTQQAAESKLHAKDEVDNQTSAAAQAIAVHEENQAKATAALDSGL